jgi:hypothetical protein
MLLFLYLGGVARGAGETDGHVVTEMESSVIRATRCNRLDRQMRPMRKLTRDQPPDERSIDLYSRGRHLFRHYVSRLIDPFHRGKTITRRLQRERCLETLAKIGLAELKTLFGRAELPDGPDKFASLEIGCFDA